MFDDFDFEFVVAGLDDTDPLPPPPLDDQLLRNELNVDLAELRTFPTALLVVFTNLPPSSSARFNFRPDSELEKRKLNLKRMSLTPS